ncbi:hypothetical protein M2333_002286 [Sphingobium sp. B11D3B]|uniref:hypothetical protein n=1 Tax=Sphingobium sp. B11D3B TaxID=2940575 RepID=UPI002227AE56|nr:hypothetical protein [Sphingobium sp. B11D3B]MCW2389240.1 hypothetical protein [Sphingobium sp. B11D3B]
MRHYRSAKDGAAALLLLLGTTGCSKSSEADNAAEIDSARVTRLFTEGFNSETTGASATEQTSQHGSQIADPRAGIPFDRSRTVTAKVEEAVSKNPGSLLSLRFALVAPGDFLRSGKARTVWARELAARSYPADTVAGATALMFGVAWELANARKLSAADNAAILRQVTTKLRGDPLERQNDERRQIQVDLRLITAGLWLEEAYLRER